MESRNRKRIGEALRRRVVEIALGAFLFAAVVGLGCWIRGAPFLTNGASEAIFEGAKSLWHQGTMAAPSFVELYEEVKEVSQQSSCRVWQDVFGLGMGSFILREESFLRSSLLHSLE